MTEEREIEEILMEASAHGMTVEVIEWARKVMTENPKIRRVDAYHEAFAEWCK